MKLFGITEQGHLREIALFGKDKAKPKKVDLDHYLSFVLRAESPEDENSYREVKIVIPYLETSKVLQKEQGPGSWSLTFFDVKVVSETLFDDSKSLLVVLRATEKNEGSVWRIQFDQ